MHLFDYEPDALDVQVSELLVATSESADPLICPEVQEVLCLLRDKLRMDVVFVSRIGEGRRTEESWCQRVVDGATELDLQRLRYTANLLASRLNRPAPQLQLQEAPRRAVH